MIESDVCGKREGQWRAAAALATRQRGLVTRAQLHRLGLSRDRIDDHLKLGLLHPVHRGVYLLGHGAQARGARELAALLAVGPPAALSHRSAVALWLPNVASCPAEIDVLICGRKARSRSGIRVRRTERLDPRDLRRRESLPLTSPARTLIDLASEADPSELERLLSEMLIANFLSTGDVLRTMRRAPAKRGSQLVRELLADHEAGFTRSEAERRLRALCREARLPQPRANVLLGRWEADFLWPDRRLVLEVDGFRFHGHRAAFERDRRKQAELVAAGYRVIRITWRQLTREPVAVAALLGGALRGGQ